MNWALIQHLWSEVEFSWSFIDCFFIQIILGLAINPINLQVEDRQISSEIRTIRLLSVIKKRHFCDSNFKIGGKYNTT